NATPKTIGEMVQMLDVLLAKVPEIMEGPHSPFISDAAHKELCLAIQQNLSNLKNMCQNFPPNLKPPPALLEYLQRARQAMQRLLPNG
ncbi:hypothetical protein L0152_25525, partial [bacterium]|nr:hypothetical protein [bacterium]